ncbi:MAG: M16 family metallopeptidase, partial [Nitrospiria bacterium]
MTSKHTRIMACLSRLASALVFALFFATLAAATDTVNPREMTFAPIVFQPPKAEKVTLSNGMTLYLLEDHELPLIELQATIRTGSIYEPADKIGLAGITGSVMRSGGNRSHSSEALDEILDQIAARLSIGIGRDSGSASLNVLKKDFDLGLKLFVESLRFPVFEEEKLTIAKNRALESIRRRNDRPSGIATREFFKQLYGADNAYARETTKETINAISRADLVSFHQHYFTPNNIILGVTGDFEKTAMIAKLEKAFAGWAQKKVDFPPVAPVRERMTGAIYKVDKAIPQTQVRIGHLGIKQKNPDFFALSIMNDVLGSGGLNSRLFQDVRTRQGLAYSVGSALRPGKFERGFFLAYGATRAEKSHQAITTMIAHIQKIREGHVTDEELHRAKEAFLNSLIFSFSSPAQIVARQISLAYYGLPEDYLEQYRANVEKVTKDDILRV